MVNALHSVQFPRLESLKAYLTALWKQSIGSVVWLTDA